MGVFRIFSSCLNSFPWLDPQIIFLYAGRGSWVFGGGGREPREGGPPLGGLWRPVGVLGAAGPLGE